MPKGIKTEFKLGKRRLDDPASLRVSAQEPHPPPVGEGSVHKETQFRSAESGLAHERAQDAEVAEEIHELDFWKKEVVEKSKVHYN